MRYLLFFAASQSCFGMDTHTFVSAMHGELGNVAVRAVLIQLPASVASVESVTYGNPQIGFFRLNHFLFRRSQIEFELIPPGYREKTQFIITATTRNGDRRHFKKDRHFDSPFPQAFLPAEGTLLHGQFSAPFFFSNARASAPLSTAPNELSTDGTPAPRQDFRLAHIINRCGELVYVLPIRHVPDSSHTHADPSGFIRNISDGFVHSLDLKSLRVARIPLSHRILAHHDLIDEQSSLIAFIKEERMTEWGLFSGAFAIVSEAVDRIARIHLDTGQVTPLWDGARAYSPLYYLREGEMTQPRPRRSKQTTHLNSITRMQDGNYLVSSYRLKRLLILNRSLTRVVATIGNTPHDTFQTPSDNPFYFQHHATQLPSGNILLFDNGTRERHHSRVLELKLVPKKALLVEYDYHTGKERARMTISSYLDPFHYRVTPIFSLGYTHWIGPLESRPTHLPGRGRLY